MQFSGILSGDHGVLVNPVKEQYEKFPYPYYSIKNLFSKPLTCTNLHANFESGASLVHKKLISHNGKKIALLGCGTNEPLVFAQSHPDASITAIDLSKKTLTHSKIKTTLNRLTNINYQNTELIEFCNQNPKTFDYVHSYGVLHHLSNPQAGFEAVSKTLKPEGFARLMVYSKSARQRISDLRRLLQLLKINFHQSSFEKQIKNFIASLPTAHPLRLTFETHPEVKTKQGLVDAFLHAQETSFYLNDLIEMLKKAGLFIHAWDFSQNTTNLINSATGQSLIEKINYLEATDQWPTPFVFWVAKFENVFTTQGSHFALNPLVKKLPEKFYSVLYKKNFVFTYRHQKLFDLAKDKKFISRFELAPFAGELHDFIATRIFLGVVQ